MSSIFQKYKNTTKKDKTLREYILFTSCCFELDFLCDCSHVRRRRSLTEGLFVCLWGWGGVGGYLRGRSDRVGWGWDGVTWEVGLHIEVSQLDLFVQLHGLQNSVLDHLTGFPPCYMLDTQVRKPVMKQTCLIPQCPNSKAEFIYNFREGGGFVLGFFSLCIF